MRYQLALLGLRQPCELLGLILLEGSSLMPFRYIMQWESGFKCPLISQYTRSGAEHVHEILETFKLKHKKRKSCISLESANKIYKKVQASLYKTTLIYLNFLKSVRVANYCIYSYIIYMLLKRVATVGFFICNMEFMDSSCGKTFPKWGEPRLLAATLPLCF